MKEEDKKQVLEEIAYFFKEEYELNLGIIGTENIYDFFQDVLGKHIYNQIRRWMMQSGFMKDMPLIWMLTIMNFIRTKTIL